MFIFRVKRQIILISVLMIIIVLMDWKGIKFLKTNQKNIP
jgi:hypothetical protein